jgi:ABC-type antimicrobial peptide transport system permease subunit
LIPVSFTKGKLALSAKHKLNAAYFTGSAMAAGLLGGLCQSWGVFWIALVVLVGCSLHSGNIRPNGRGPRG